MCEYVCVCVHLHTYMSLKILQMGCIYHFLNPTLLNEGRIWCFITAVYIFVQLQQYSYQVTI